MITTKNARREVVFMPESIVANSGYEERPSFLGEDLSEFDY
jgi:hypothetical protein